MESTSPSSDWIELLRRLNAAGARYSIVGAHAVGLYATPRATGDLDIWIERSKENAKRVYSALVAFGAPLGELPNRLEGTFASVPVAGRTKDLADLESLDVEKGSEA